MAIFIINPPKNPSVFSRWDVRSELTKINQMKNIQIKGYKQTSSGTDDYRRGDEIRPTIVGTINEAFKILNLVSESQPSLVVG